MLGGWSRRLLCDGWMAPSGMAWDRLPGSDIEIAVALGVHNNR
jgi:hypothetical protein